MLLAFAALVPYVILLARRSPTMDSGQKLTVSHAPDFFRVPELLGFAVLAVIVLGRRAWKD